MSRKADPSAGLSPETACTFTIPRGFNYARIKELHKKMQKLEPVTYKGLQGRTMYFDFPDSVQRDIFLHQLEIMISRHGNQTQRV